ncbi:hypothetical protein B0H16DRAFT_1769962 [Mycena metata]|uniref:Helicase C-terminal domain-containing protein n=1 Tax=Mycena metata TaxID=1033252 RepID=A0AAD7MUN0_9AGAR|nr:hypothetical protein B0H16DRAFT_1769962 [Mycena metata]
MAPKASTSKASTSKASTSKAPRLPLEGLGFILSTLIWAGERVVAKAEEEEEEEEDEDEDEDDVPLLLPPALRSFVAQGFPPLWLESCPESHAEWKEHWTPLREKFPCGQEYANERLKAKFGKSAAQQFFIDQAVKNGWPAILDGLITTQLESRGKTFKTLYADPGFETSRMTGKYPSVEQWSESKAEVLRYLFGTDLVRTIVPQPLSIWWGYVMSKYVEREKVAAGRQRNKYEALCKKIMALLGEDFLMGSDDAAKKFTARKCGAAIKILRQISGLLEWEILTTAELKALETQLQPVTPDSIEAEAEPEPITPASIRDFDAELTPGAKKHEYVARVLGWMTRMLELCGSKSQLPAEIEEGLQPYQIQGFARVEAVDMYLFHDEVQAFVADWQGKDHTTIDDGVIRLLSGDDPAGGLKDWLEGGKDLGVESFCKLTAIQLEDLLGATEGRFPTFRKHVTEKFAEYQGDQDVEIPGVTRVFALRHHQLVAIAAILTRAVNPIGLSRWPPKQPNVTDASPLALRQHWGSLPGHWLADTLFSRERARRRRAMPHILGTEERFKFGPCDEIPKAPHILVVPGSLLGQWGDQLKRVFKANAAAIRVIRVAKKHWAKDMEVSPNVLPVNTTYVVALTTLVRMAKEAGISGHPPEFRAPPTGDNGTVKEHTLFDMSFGVCIADEAHEFRKGNSAHQAMWAFSDLCLITVLASATPLIEGLADVHEQARIIRPRGLTEAVDGSLTTQLALVKKICSRSHVDRAADLEAFMKAMSTEAATEGKDADAEKPLTAVEKAQRRGVERLKEICLRNTIRRTGQSATPDGKTITGSLPPSTFIHVVFEPLQAEVDASRALEETNVTEGRLETARRVDAFYNDARKYLSYPPGIRTNSRAMTVDARPAGQPLSKLSVLTELIIKTLRDGPETMVAADVLGTNTKILKASDMGLPNVAAEDYQPAKLLAGEGLNEKVVVFTQYAQFHPVMKVYLESAGISVATVSGAMPARQRHEVISNFAGSNKRCLILSNVGSTGVDLTFARNVVIYEQLWSGVLTNQMLGRVDREGQTRETFCWSLAGQGTIDMLLMLMALRKASIAKDYMTLDRRADFFKTYVALLADGEAQEDEAAPEIDEIDVEIEEELGVAAILKEAIVHLQSPYLLKISATSFLQLTTTALGALEGRRVLPLNPSHPQDNSPVHPCHTGGGRGSSACTDVAPVPAPSKARPSLAVHAQEASPRSPGLPADWIQYTAVCGVVNGRE